MKNRLFIRIPDRVEQAISWALWNSDEKSWQEEGELLSVDLVALAELSQKNETVVIVPSSQVSSKKVITPAKQLKQIQRAVPYMLEDQLANSIEQLHFAYGKRERNGELPVYWTSHDLMKQWTRWFEQAELSIDIMISASDLLNLSEDTTEIYLIDDFAIVNETSNAQWTCQRDLLPELWDMNEDREDNLDTDVSDPEAINNSSVIRVFYTDDLEDYWAQQESVVSNQLSSVDLIKHLGEAYTKEKINLLQFEYQPKKQSQLPWQKFKPLGYAAAVSLVIFLCFQGSNYYVLSQENTVVREQAEQLFNKVFSRRPRTGSILGQAQRLLSRSDQQAEQGEFITLLNKTVAQITSLEQIKPTSISFDGRKREMRVDVLAPDYQALNNFKDALVKTGLNVDMSSASSQGNAYSTRLIIRSGS
ncbi:MAG: hypothetical protein HWE27_01725 [Gammaproteobacteria bacterium]|nr:hypothetical protein [Gammaproteobacteria bacterium]